MPSRLDLSPHIRAYAGIKNLTVFVVCCRLGGDILFVVFTERGNDTIRIISARPAQTEEINEYFSNYDT